VGREDKHRIENVVKGGLLDVLQELVDLVQGQKHRSPEVVDFVVGESTNRHFSFHLRDRLERRLIVGLRESQTLLREWAINIFVIQCPVLDRRGTESLSPDSLRLRTSIDVSLESRKIQRSHEKILTEHSAEVAGMDFHAMLGRRLQVCDAVSIGVNERFERGVFGKGLLFFQLAVREDERGNVSTRWQNNPPERQIAEGCLGEFEGGVGLAFVCGFSERLNRLPPKRKSMRYTPSWTSRVAISDSSHCERGITSDAIPT
jgi:hypothetical protein